MDTQSLQAFLAVADSGSFSRAAEQLHLTQPAVSKRIAVLEGQIDARLFDRIGRRVSPHRSRPGTAAPGATDPGDGRRQPPGAGQPRGQRRLAA